MIDLAAPPPKGTGVQKIRECIIQDKMTFDVSSDDCQVFLKDKIMNNIERYFTLVGEYYVVLDLLIEHHGSITV